MKSVAPLRRDDAAGVEQREQQEELQDGRGGGDEETVPDDRRHRPPLRGRRGRRLGETAGSGANLARRKSEHAALPPFPAAVPVLRSRAGLEANNTMIRCNIEALKY